MSIIILTPKPSNPPTASDNLATAANSPTIAQRLESQFLHLLGLEGHTFETYEQLRDFAETQIAAAAAVVPAAVDAAAPVASDAPPAA